MIFPALPQAPPASDWPLTRAERSGYTETSRHQEVLDFLETLKAKNPALRLETFGKSAEGRALPLAILGWEGEAGTSTGSVTASPSRGKPVVLVLANIHAGEVEGKEASLRLLRDASQGKLDGILKKVVLLVAPIYNADGNERIGIRNRPSQNGPSGGVGVRENAQGLDLNRDFIKAEAPETRALIEGVFRRWDPDLTIDLHTTNGSHHGYHLTYAAPMHPNTDGGLTDFLRGRLLPAVTKSLAAKGWRVFYYGNFEGGTRERPEFWSTFDYRPRFGTNYAGLRNRMAVLSEAYSYLDFKTRVDVTDAFTREILGFVARNASLVRRLTRRADSERFKDGLRGAGLALNASAEPSNEPADILLGSVSRETDPATGITRTVAKDEHRPVAMRLKQVFQALRVGGAPDAYLIRIEGKTERLIALLELHGVLVERNTNGGGATFETFRVRSVRIAERSFQGHREVIAEGEWTPSTVFWQAGEHVRVTCRQPLARLVFELLEPESSDGAVTWNFLDEYLKDLPGNWPVVRAWNSEK